MLRRVHISLLSFIVLASPVLVPLSASAQSDEQRGAARDLATEGADAYDAGRYQDAIDRFTRAEALVHATPHLLFLARSHAKLNQFVKAREAYLKIIREPVPANASQVVKDAKANAQDELGPVEAKIGRLTIDVQGKEQAKDLVVKVNGAPMPAVLIGAAQPIDPGSHRVEAIATGFRAPTQTVAIGEGERKAIVLRLESDPNAVSPGAAPPPQAGSAPPEGSSSAPRDEGASSGSSGMRIGSYVAFGVGAVGLGVGTYFLIESSSKRSEADDLCTLAKGACDRAVEDDVEALDAEANEAGTIGIAGMIVGGVGVATGVTLLVLSSGSSSGQSGSGKPSGPYVAPFIGRNTIGVKGAF
jgi:tetratricopeptide (TPR) repeat protein